MKKRPKAKTIATKRHKNRGRIGLSSEGKDPDQVKSKYWVPKLDGGEATSDSKVKLKAALYSHSKVNVSL